MNKQHLYGLINPFFERIAGLKALLWGLAGMVVSTALSFYSGWHYHGLLHFWSGSESGVVVLCGGAPCRPADSGCYVLFGRIAAFPFTHTDGRCVGNGRFRTIAVDRHEPFQLLLPPMQKLAQIDVNMPPTEIMQQPGFLVGIGCRLSLLSF